jgi:hypothetical protein
MVGLEQRVLRRAEARLRGAEVVARRSSSDLGEHIRDYVLGGVLTGARSEHVLEDLLGCSFELIDELYARVETLEGAKEAKETSTGAKEKSTGGKEKSMRSKK